MMERDSNNTKRKEKLISAAIDLVLVGLWQCLFILQVMAKLKTLKFQRKLNIIGQFLKAFPNNTFVLERHIYIYI